MSRQLVYDPIRTISIAAGYAPLGAAFSHSATIVKVVNLSDNTIFISPMG